MFLLFVVANLDVVWGLGVLFYYDLAGIDLIVTCLDLVVLCFVILNYCVLNLFDYWFDLLVS